MNLLIQYCKHAKLQPLFVMQTLNPYAYDSLQKLTPIVEKLNAMVVQNGFTLCNLWVDKKENYTKGTLTDVMHLGQLGWYKVDEAIYDYFFKNNLP
jgi:D-alanine transfer protein